MKEKEQNISIPRIILCNSTIFFNKNLNDIDIRIFALISTLSFKKGYCYANNNYLKNVLNKSERTIQRSLERLQKEKYIIITKKAKEKRKIYTYEEYAIKFKDSIKFEDEYDWLNE